MPFRIREPENQREIDRNLAIVWWLLILPSLSLLFVFNGYVLALFVIGGIARQITIAIRLPAGERGYFEFLCYALLVSLPNWRLEFIQDWMILVIFWGFLIYSEWRFFRYNQAGQARDGNPGPVES